LECPQDAIEGGADSAWNCGLVIAVSPSPAGGNKNELRSPFSLAAGRQRRWGHGRYHAHPRRKCGWRKLEPSLRSATKFFRSPRWTVRTRLGAHQARRSAHVPYIILALSKIDFGMPPDL